MIKALSYVVVETPHLEAWMEQAEQHIGLQVEVVEAGRCVCLRADEKFQRLLVTRTEGQASMGMGFELDNAEQLQTIRQRLEEAGYATTEGTAEELALRGVAGMIHFRDPDGVRLEVCHGLADAATPFVPGRPLGGFRTGDMGIGHVALITEHFDELSHLYRNIFGFRVSDHTQAPFRVEFLHCNPRHHTMGLAHTGGPAKIYHLMLEYNDFDDLGRAYDMALEKPESIGPNWQVEELQGMSLWGHDRTWLPDHKREEARQILKRLAHRVCVPRSSPTRKLPRPHNEYQCIPGNRQAHPDWRMHPQLP